MENQTSELLEKATELLEKVRQQFDTAPYPRVPLEYSPKNEPNVLYIHNLVTAYYLRDRKVISTKDTVILDAGCGSGYKSLVLAHANPGARIVGIDLSEESVKLARQRLQHHGFENSEFHAMSIEDLPELNLQFDYINADEVLYLLPDPVKGLQAMRSVLKPEGMIRTNFHSSLQRFIYFRAQKFFKMMGLMEGAPQETELELVRETMKSLKDHTFLKTTAWKADFVTDDEILLANYLLRGDKGYTIPEFFSALRAADLEFISMVQWRQWNLLDVFKDVDELPIAIAMSLAEKSMEEQLHLLELLHPIHRLLDLWCSHPREAQAFVPVSEWVRSDWQQATIHLHPQLRTPELTEDLIACARQLRMFDISRHLSIPEGPVNIDSTVAACLLPLTEGCQSMASLVRRWQQLRPVDPATLEPTDGEEAFEFIQQTLTQLKGVGYILLELPG